MVEKMQNKAVDPSAGSHLVGPPIVPAFLRELDRLVALARRGQKPDSPFFNPSDQWLVSHMPVFQDLPPRERALVLEEAKSIAQEAQEARKAGKAAARTWSGAVVRLDNGGLAFFSQLGVVRRPDLTQYFIDGFPRNRDALAFSQENQQLFARVFQYINSYLETHLGVGDAIIQTDRQIGDAPGRSFHARQMLFGTQYLQIPYMWRQLTFDLPEGARLNVPDILEVSVPRWLEDLGLDQELKTQLKDKGFNQLVFKAPTKGLSLHLGFDYVGEHKMGPLSIAMFLVKQSRGLAVQAALSMARVRALDGEINNCAMVTIGPSLHGKSTLTIMIELADSELSRLLGLPHHPEEGVYPMNDDIVLLQPLAGSNRSVRRGRRIQIPYGIDGTENNFYAVPFGLTPESDPITYDALRGSPGAPNPQETLENVPVDPETGKPNYLENPVRNMRMILSRPQLLARKGAAHLLRTITEGKLSEAVHVPMEYADRILWQAVMRQNTVVPPLRRLTLDQYIRVLMYGEAVQMGAAAGALGRPYVEYFSDPFIIGLEDDNANLMYTILKEMANGGLPQEYYAFNTGGIGADTNDEASGRLYKKIPRELTLTLQEAVLRGAVLFEHDDISRSDVAVAVVDPHGKTVLDLRSEWLPKQIYGEAEYRRRVAELSQRRYYGRDAKDRAGILRYTRVMDAILNPEDIPAPQNERELAWLLSFYWKVEQAYHSLPDLARHLGEGSQPSSKTQEVLGKKYQAGLAQGLSLSKEGQQALSTVGLGPQ
jgi:hypothetical protein